MILGRPGEKVTKRLQSRNNPRQKVTKERQSILDDCSQFVHHFRFHGAIMGTVKQATPPHAARLTGGQNQMRRQLASGDKWAVLQRRVETYKRTSYTKFIFRRAIQ